MPSVQPLPLECEVLTFRKVETEAGYDLGRQLGDPFSTGVIINKDTQYLTASGPMRLAWEKDSGARSQHWVVCGNPEHSLSLLSVVHQT